MWLVFIVIILNVKKDENVSLSVHGRNYELQSEYSEERTCRVCLCVYPHVEEEEEERLAGRLIDLLMANQALEPTSGVITEGQVKELSLYSKIYHSHSLPRCHHQKTVEKNSHEELKIKSNRECRMYLPRKRSYNVSLISPVSS